MVRVDGDMKTVGKLNALLKDNNPYRFVVIHLRGSHAPYTNFDALDDSFNFSDYDKTIHHTDRVLNEIVQTLAQSNQQYVLFYTSDHGEIIDVGHGIQYGGANQYIIPLMIKSNFDNQYCNFIERSRNKNGYISGLMNKFLLAQMLGYTIDAKKLRAEKNNDRVLHSDGKVYDFMKFPSQQ